VKWVIWVKRKTLSSFWGWKESKGNHYLDSVPAKTKQKNIVFILRLKTLKNKILSSFWDWKDWKEKHCYSAAAIGAERR
jgi:hypothetical protein